jgi:hypothetical protein
MSVKGSISEAYLQWICLQPPMRKQASGCASGLLELLSSCYQRAC